MQTVREREQLKFLHKRIKFSKDRLKRLGVLSIGHKSSAVSKFWGALKQEIELYGKSRLSNTEEIFRKVLADEPIKEWCQGKCNQSSKDTCGAIIDDVDKSEMRMEKVSRRIDEDQETIGKIESKNNKKKKKVSRQEV